MSEKQAYQITVEFLQKHRRADELICDAKTKLPIMAIYRNPEYAFKKETESLLGKLREMIEDDERHK